MASSFDESKMGEYPQLKQRVADELKSLYSEHKAHKELRYFPCDGHDFLEIPTIREIPDDLRSNFDVDGKLTDEYLRNLYRKYSTSPMATDLSSVDETSRQAGPPAERSVEKPQLHWVKEDDVYASTLTLNFPHLLEIGGSLLGSLGTIYGLSPETETLMGKWRATAETIYAFEFTLNLMNNYDPTHAQFFERAAGLEMAWQFSQVLLVGYVSETLTDMLEAEKSTLTAAFGTDATPAENARRGSTMMFKSASRAPPEIEMTHYITAEAEFLSCLPEPVLHHICLFVARAREKRHNPPDDDTYLRQVADQGSEAAKLRLQCVTILETAPYSVYDFYSLPVLTRMLWRPDPNGGGKSAPKS